MHWRGAVPGRAHPAALPVESDSRPNPLGLTVMRLLKRRENFLEVGGVDMIEGTPILDIKPYTRRDRKPDARFGWLERTCR